jgi:hypothetical protein
MNATEKRQIKRENEGHVWHFFAFSPKFWFLSFGGLEEEEEEDEEEEKEQQNVLLFLLLLLCE